MLEEQSGRWPTTLVAGVAVGVVEVLFAVAFASLVFGGRIGQFLAEGIALYVGAAFLTLAVVAWRAGGRGVVGGLHATGAVLLAIVASTTGLSGSPEAGFLSVIAATAIVTVLCGVVFLVLGVRRRGDVLRVIPVPVVGGFLAGAGWVLLQGAIHVAIDEPLFYTDLADLFDGRALKMWVPAVGFGALLVVAARLVKRPLALVVGIVVGVVAFFVVALAVGATIDDARGGGWLLGPFTEDMGWNTWTVAALPDADWLAVARSWAAIVVAVVVAALVLLFTLGEVEAVLGRDLDTDEELRDAGLLNLVAGALGGIPASHSRSFTSVAAGMHVDARLAGLIAAAVALVVLAVGATVIELVPRAIVGGLLAYLGLSFVVEWLWDRRRSLSRVEYVVVLVILGVVVLRGYLPGFVVGVVLAVVMFAVSYGRVDLVREVAFGEVYRSTVDRPPTERQRLHAAADRVQVLRLSGHVFFGSTNRLLERIKARAEGGAPPRFHVVDLTRVTGVDASAAATLAKAERLTAPHGAGIVLAGASDHVRARLERGGALGTQGLVSFAPDLDAALQGCEEALLEGDTAGAVAPSLDGIPPGLLPHLERLSYDEGTVLLRQDEPPGDVYVLAEGRLAVETLTSDGRRMRVRTLRPGVVVGEVALYTGEPRTADVVAASACVVFRCSRDVIARIETEDPEVAAALHRWLAATLADRLGDTMRTFDAVMD